MKDNNIKIIDKTLTVLWDNYSEKLQNNIPLTKQLVKLLSDLGCSFVEITPELYSKIYPIPLGVNFIVNVNKEIAIKRGDLLEVTLKKCKNLDKNEAYRIIGLSDIMFYDYREKFTVIKEYFGSHVELEPLNSNNLATATAYEWINHGGNTVVGTCAGIGNYLPIEELICYLKFIHKKDLPGDTTLLPQILDIFEMIMGIKLPTNKPVMGEKIFDVESGIHVDGIMKNPDNYEPYSPYIVGRKRNIIIGKHSGKNALKYKLQELNILLQAESFNSTLDLIKRESSRLKRALRDDEILRICKGGD